jgi:hypothetical protein
LTVGTANIPGTITATGEISGKEILATNGIIFNSRTITGNYDIPVGYNGMSVGPIVMENTANITLTDGRWIIL